MNVMASNDSRQADGHRRTQDDAVVEERSNTRTSLATKIIRAFVRPEEGDLNLSPAELAETVADRLRAYAVLERKRIQDGIDASGFTDTQLTAIIGRDWVRVA